MTRVHPIATYEMSKYVQELDEITQHARLFLTALLSLQRQVIPPKPARLVDVFKRWVRRGRRRTSVRRCTRTCHLPVFVGMPLVYAMTAGTMVSA